MVLTGCYDADCCYVLAETSIFTLPGVMLHKDPGLRSSSVAAGRHKNGQYLRVAIATSDGSRG